MTDWAVVFATLLGPIFAVQTQKWIERGTERKQKRQQIFQVLMATRAIRAGSSEHVQALNLIDLFFDRKTEKDKVVRSAWRVYLDDLGTNRIDPQQPDAQLRVEKSINLLADLLYAMSQALNYDFDKVQIKRGAYYPQGHHDDLIGRQIIRDGLVRIAQGQAAVPVVVIPTETSLTASARQNST